MTRSGAIALTLALVTAVASAAPSDSNHSRTKLPPTLTVVGNSQPFFVSAASVTGSDGRIDWAGFADDNVRTILRAEEARVAARAAESANASNDTAPCATRTVTFGLAPRQGSITAVTARAAAVYRGRIAATAPGFLLTTPVTLLGIEITSVVRSADGYPRAQLIYVTYPGADFRIGGRRFCNGGPNDGFIPAVGDEILVLAQQPSRDMTGAYLTTTEEQLFFSRDNRVIVSESIAKDPALPVPLTLQALARMVAPANEAR